MSVFLYILNNLILLGLIVLAVVLVWKISKTVIQMVIGFVIVGFVLWGVYEIYKVGLGEVAEGSGYLVVFIKGLEIFLIRLKDILI